MRRWMLVAVCLLLIGGIAAFFTFESAAPSRASSAETVFTGEGANWVGSYTVTPREAKELGYSDRFKLTFKKADQPRGDVIFRLRISNGNEMSKIGPYTPGGIELPGGGSYVEAIPKDDQLDLTVEWSGQIEHITLSRSN
ncbi:MAG: hypothetical protein WCC10_07925 [Tumebacillaceae bacterium]